MIQYVSTLFNPPVDTGTPKVPIVVCGERYRMDVEEKYRRVSDDGAIRSPHAILGFSPACEFTVGGGCIHDAGRRAMQRDQDVRDVLLAIHSLLRSVSIMARSPNFEAVRDTVALALSEPGTRTQPIIAVSAAFNDIPILRDAGDTVNAKNAYRH